ncbi:MAG: ferritin-like domain-containing protein [Deltaproteobacteria bacterium]|nr:ferritin-like domain-containing protein [Deltaproteobacteria bacterium]
MEDRQLTYPIGLLSYYREAELRGADLLQRLLRKADDGELQIKLTRHLADEARHAWQWTELICELGGEPAALRTGSPQWLRRQVGLPSSILDLLALTQVVEERVRQRYREHAARPGEEPRIVAVLQTILGDEEWHLAWVEDWLAKAQKKEGRTRVTAALDHYRALEVNAYAELMREEEKLRAAEVSLAIVPW